MRIVQLSDIHLSASNQQDLNVYFLDALITDLLTFHTSKKIDILLLTGDLVDKCGDSLGDNPYEVFQDKFLTRICNALNLESEQVLFIPGNHDIERKYIETENEYYLANTLTPEGANEQLIKQKHEIQNSNKRIERFKLFEKGFHRNTPDYDFSFNESTVIRQDGEYKVGFALINDSWRCSSKLEKEQHFVGTSQIKNAKLFFDNHNTDVNIVVFHHPLEAINSFEKDEFENFLQTFHFDIAFFGHSHTHKSELINSSIGGIISIRTRTALNNPNESETKYQPGYSILDIDIKNQRYVLYARKFMHVGYRFDKDLESLKDGQVTGFLSKPQYVPLNGDIKTDVVDLPSGYSADVNKVVKLLIGKSLYPNKHIFVRELIQNSVDACKRAHERKSHLQPKINVFINTADNSFEIVDEGDGMSKKVLREHFSIVGKSISQEFSEALNSVNLISQFGIGFISTFIVSEKIYVSTISEEDGLINFEIDDVFKGFDYSDVSNTRLTSSQLTGTSIKVFLKSPFQAANLLDYVRSYCRHVENLTYYFNEVLQPQENSWNTAGGVFYYNQKTATYECKLTISNVGRSFIATNSGFLINENATQIIPYQFPYIIGGEVVFEPRSIDFDLSRTNIINSEKSLEFKRSISISMRNLFRDVLESEDTELKSTVVRYLQYYLSVYDGIKEMVTETYVSFYSKSELIKLCSDYTYFDFLNQRRPLSEILIMLRAVGLEKLYYYKSSNNHDIGTIISNFLSSNGNFVFYPLEPVVSFRDGAYAFSLAHVVTTIAKESGILVINLEDSLNDEVSKILTPRTNIPKRLDDSLTKIESLYGTKVQLARFGAAYDLLLNRGDITFINCDHSSFLDLINNVSKFTDQALEIFLLGVLGCNLSLAISGNSILSNKYQSDN